MLNQAIECNVKAALCNEMFYTLFTISTCVNITPYMKVAIISALKKNNNQHCINQCQWYVVKVTVWDVK